MTALKETCIALHSLAHCQDSSSSLKDEGGGAVRSRQMFRSKLHGGGKAMSTHVTRGERWQKKRNRSFWNDPFAHLICFSFDPFDPFDRYLWNGQEPVMITNWSHIEMTCAVQAFAKLFTSLMPPARLQGGLINKVRDGQSSLFPCHAWCNYPLAN